MLRDVSVRHAGTARSLPTRDCCTRFFLTSHRACITTPPGHESRPKSTGGQRLGLEIPPSLVESPAAPPHAGVGQAWHEREPGEGGRRRVKKEGRRQEALGRIRSRRHRGGKRPGGVFSRSSSSPRVGRGVEPRDSLQSDIVDDSLKRKFLRECSCECRFRLLTAT